MIKSFAKRFYEKIKPKVAENMFCVEMGKEKFIEALDEEIESYAKDTQAEVGMGIYKIIQERKKVNLSDSEILKMIENLCMELMNKSPECAMEFSKRIEERHGI